MHSYDISTRKCWVWKKSRMKKREKKKRKKKREREERRVCSVLFLFCSLVPCQLWAFAFLTFTFIIG